jgi:hypothetical protein
MRDVSSSIVCLCLYLALMEGKFGHCNCKVNLQYFLQSAILIAESYVFRYISIMDQRKY